MAVLKPENNMTITSSDRLATITSKIKSLESIRDTDTFLSQSRATLDCIVDAISELKGLVEPLVVEKEAPPSEVRVTAFEETVVHILQYGATLCGYGRGTVPGDWDTGHLWVDKLDCSNVPMTQRCEQCYSIYNPIIDELMDTISNELCNQTEWKFYGLEVLSTSKTPNGLRLELGLKDSKGEALKTTGVYLAAQEEKMPDTTITSKLVKALSEIDNKFSHYYILGQATYGKCYTVAMAMAEIAQRTLVDTGFRNSLNEYAEKDK